MNRHKKRIYGMILTLAAGALLLDRGLFQPAATPASALGAAKDRLGAWGIDTPKGPAVSVAVSPFPDGLPPVVPAAALRDLFATTGAVRAKLLGMSPEDGDGAWGTDGQALSVTTLTPEWFIQNHRLTAVLLGRRSEFAIVDGKWLRVGDRLDRCELIEITGTTAAFRCPTGKAVLSVAGVPSPPNPETQ